MKRHLTLLLTLMVSAACIAQNALQFDGSNDQMNCGTDPAYNVGGTAFTVEAWIKASGWNSNIFDGSIVLKENNANNGGWMLRAGNGGRLGCGIGDGMNGAWKEINSSTAILSLNSWHHVAMTYDGSYLRLYKDGLIVDSLSTSISVRINTLTPLTVGYHPTYGRTWNGAIDEVRVWNRTLSRTELNMGKDEEICSTPGTDLKAYYKFSQGTPYGNNTSIDSITDYSIYGNQAALSNFAMVSASSNLVPGANLDRDSTHSYDTLVNCTGFYHAPTKTFYNSSGNYPYRLPNYMGCDSIINIQVTILGNSHTSIDTTVCDSFIGPDDKVYKKSASFTTVLTNSVGCDSIINVELTVGADSGFVDTTVCDLYLSPAGKNISMSGVYYDTLSSYYQCDSIVRLKVTVNHSTIEQQNALICDSVLAPSGQHWYYSPGIYLDTLSGYFGCDSVIELTLNSARTTGQLSTDVCNEFISPSGKTYTSTGQYLDTLINYLNCDSIISIDLMVRKWSSADIEINACDSARSVSGKYLYTEDGTYYDTLINAAGCDSFISMQVDITIAEANIAIQDDYTLSSTPADTYQWLHCDSSYMQIEGADSQTFQYPHRGSFAVEITENSCIDTSTCLSIAGLAIEVPKRETGIIYPNPTSGIIYIQSDKSESMHLRLYSILAEQVFEQHTVYPNEAINLGELRPGIYYLHIDEEHGQILILR